MSWLKGIVVRLKTGSAKFAGTDDLLFLGVSGSDGGREFPLEVRSFDDAERLSEVKYVLGAVWDLQALPGARQPRFAEKEWNDPALFYIGFESIDRVYLRKQAGRRPAADDAWQLDEIEIALYGETGRRRVFFSNTAVWLGLRYGLQVWIPERTSAR